jgi:hypothetical protein
VVAATKILTGDKPEALQALRDPRVLAVVWKGAWSEASLQFATQVAGTPVYNVAWSKPVWFQKLGSTETGPLASKAFRSDYFRIRRIFDNLRVKAFDEPVTLDYSRIEPATADRGILDAGQWHIHRKPTLLTIPAGVTTEYLDPTIKGQRSRHPEIANDLNFTPEDPVAAEQSAKRLPNNAVMVFKRLIHRRPNTRIAARHDTARVIVQFTVEP